MTEQQRKWRRIWQEFNRKYVPYDWDKQKILLARLIQQNFSEVHFDFPGIWSKFDKTWVFKWREQQRVIRRIVDEIVTTKWVVEKSDVVSLET